MSRITATRRLQFCAGHRVFLHESKCRNMHGHNYVLYFTAQVNPNSGVRQGDLDSLGRVIDFGVMKEKLGTWIDENWDHGFIYFAQDQFLRDLFVGSENKSFALPTNPTAENMAAYLLWRVCPVLFKGTGIDIIRIVLHETENCSAEVSGG